MIAHVIPAIFGLALALGVIYASVAVALRNRKGQGISILIPFRAPSDPQNARIRNVNWLKQYWAAHLPGAEIIVGEDPSLDLPFSKSVAVNDAVSRATG